MKKLLFLSLITVSSSYAMYNNRQLNNDTYRQMNFQSPVRRGPLFDMYTFNHARMGELQAEMPNTRRQLAQDLSKKSKSRLDFLSQKYVNNPETQEQIKQVRKLIPQVPDGSPVKSSKFKKSDEKILQEALVGAAAVAQLNQEDDSTIAQAVRATRNNAVQNPANFFTSNSNRLENLFARAQAAQVEQKEDDENQDNDAVIVAAPAPFVLPAQALQAPMQLVIQPQPMQMQAPVAANNNYPVAQAQPVMQLHVQAQNLQREVIDLTGDDEDQLPDQIPFGPAPRAAQQRRVKLTPYEKGQQTKLKKAAQGNQKITHLFPRI